MAEESEIVSLNMSNEGNGSNIDESATSIKSDKSDALLMNGKIGPPSHPHHHHHNHHHHHHQHKKDLPAPPPHGNFYNNSDEKSDLSAQNGEDDGLGPLPPKWEKAYTESGETYFIDHNTGTSHWLDPRLSKFQKKSLEDCLDDELPYGWEKICDPQYGTYFIDHVNRKTQYENPVLQAKRMAERSNIGVYVNGGGHDNDRENNLFTKNPSELCGERISTTLLKSTRGLGFTIVGGDDNVEEFLQIKSIVPNGPAWLDGKLKTGDVLVFVNDICVLGFTHHEMVNIFQSIMPGEQVQLDVCRGYPLPFDPNDPNTEVVTTIAVDGLNNSGTVIDADLKFLEIDGTNGAFLDSADVQHKNPLAKLQSGVNSNGGDVYFNDTLSYQQHYKNKSNSFEIPEILHINIVKGNMGFGFTIADSAYGQKVKKILDRQCCKNLMEGDILLSINSISVKNMTHNEVVQVLKDCPKSLETTLKVQRGSSMMTGTSKMTNKMRKGIELAKFGTSIPKKEGYGIGGNSLFRSKTPTADLYSTQPKEILPSRPKTPLVDTRARAKTPSLPLTDLNTDEIEQDVNKNNGDPKIDLNLNMKSGGSFHDNDSITNDIASYNNDEQYHPQKHNQNLNDRLGELTINSSNNSNNEAIYHNHHQFQQNQQQQNYNRNFNQIYSPPLLPPPPAPPISASMVYHQNPHQLQPTYHHENCFCYDCQDYQRQQQHLSRQYMHHQNQNNPPIPYNLPPQMSDNIGKRLNDYLMDRKRSIQSNHQQYDHYHQQQQPHQYDQTYYNQQQQQNWKLINNSQHSPQQYVHSNYHHSGDEYTLTEVTLERQALGFGFRIVGGTEEGSQVTVGHIVPGGAADKDTRIATGDEILNINGVNVENASHHRVVQLMGEAGLRGQVIMILRRRKGSNKQINTSSTTICYPYNVLVARNENEGFGFVIISSSSQYYGSSIGKLIPGSPAERCGELKIGDRIIAVNSIDITGLSHGDVVNLIKESGLQVQLTIGCPRENNNQIQTNQSVVGVIPQQTTLTTTTASSSSTASTSNNDGFINTANNANNNRFPAIIS